MVGESQLQKHVKIKQLLGGWKKKNLQELKVPKSARVS